MPFRPFFRRRRQKSSFLTRYNRFNRQNRRAGSRRRFSALAPPLDETTSRLPTLPSENNAAPSNVPRRADKKTPTKPNVSSGFSTGSRSRTGTPLRAMDFESIASANSANPAKGNRRSLNDAYIISQKSKSARGILLKFSFFSFPILAWRSSRRRVLFSACRLRQEAPSLNAPNFGRGDSRAFRAFLSFCSQRQFSNDAPPKPTAKKKENPDETKRLVGAQYRIPESNRDTLAGNGF